MQVKNKNKMKSNGDDEEKEEEDEETYKLHYAMYVYVQEISFNLYQNKITCYMPLLFYTLFTYNENNSSSSSNTV